jgi:hypothetical protein
LWHGDRCAPPAQIDETRNKAASVGGPLSFNLMSASGTDVEKYMSRRLYNAGTFALMMLNGLAAMTTRGKVSRLRRKVRRRHDPIRAGADRL